jgi:hypothetical protein
MLSVYALGLCSHPKISKAPRLLEVIPNLQFFFLILTICFASKASGRVLPTLGHMGQGDGHDFILDLLGQKGADLH